MMTHYWQKWHFAKHRLTYPETKIVLRHEIVDFWHIVFPRTDSHIQGVQNGRNEQQYAGSHVRPKRWKRELFEKHQRHFALLIILDEGEVKPIVSKGKKAGEKTLYCTEIKFLAECNLSICPVRASRMVTSRHPWVPWIGVSKLIFFCGEERFTNRKSVKSDLCLSVSYVRSGLCKHNIS